MRELILEYIRSDILYDGTNIIMTIDIYCKQVQTLWGQVNDYRKIIMICVYNVQ